MYQAYTYTLDNSLTVQLPDTTCVACPWHDIHMKSAPMFREGPNVIRDSHF